MNVDVAEVYTQFAEQEWDRLELVDGSLDTSFFTDGNSPGLAGMLWHWFRAKELKQLAESQGLTTITMASCQSLSTGLPEDTNHLCQEDDKWERWLEILLEYALEPAVVDMAEHILYIGRKK